MNLRVKKENKYTTVDNGFINDPRLSPASIGVLLYLMSKPDDWKAHKKEIVKRFEKTEIKTTKNLIDNVFKELRKAGYVRMMPIAAGGGKFKGTEYEIREISDIPYLPTSEDVPTSEDNRPSEIKPPLLSTDLILSTEEEEIKTKKKNIKKKSPIFFQDSDIGTCQAFLDYFESLPKFKDVDHKYYFDKIDKWGSVNKRTNWKRTAQTFMINDNYPKFNKTPATTPQKFLYIYKIGKETRKHSDKQRWMRDKRMFFGNGYQEIKTA